MFSLVSSYMSRACLWHTIRVVSRAIDRWAGGGFGLSWDLAKLLSEATRHLDLRVFTWEVILPGYLRAPSHQPITSTRLEQMQHSKPCGYGVRAPSYLPETQIRR